MTDQETTMDAETVIAVLERLLRNAQALHTHVQHYGGPGIDRSAIATAKADVDALERAIAAVKAQQWHPIETCPKGRIVLMFAVTDWRADGQIGNWKKATGNFDFDGDGLTWDGDRITKPYQHRPTHWKAIDGIPDGLTAPPTEEPTR